MSKDQIQLEFTKQADFQNRQNKDMGLASIILQEKLINYQIKRSNNRRTLTLSIDKRGLIAHAPTKLSDKAIIDFIHKKSNWIIPRLDEFIKYQKINSDQIYIYGQLFKIETAKIQIQNPINYLEKKILINNQQNIKEEIKKIIGNIAKTEINKRLPYLAGKMQINSPKYKISKAESRWGSCSKTQGLTFSWKLGCVFPMLIDYVIVHELAHLSYMNHSKQFWNLVGKYYPAWKLARCELKEFELKLIDI